MARQKSDNKIHAVQCPQCSSTEQTSIREGFYRCANCGTEYFIASNAAKHYHYYNPPKNGGVSEKDGDEEIVIDGETMLGFAIIGLIILLAVGCVYFYFSGGKSEEKRSNRAGWVPSFSEDYKADIVGNVRRKNHVGRVLHGQGYFFTDSRNRMILLEITGDLTEGYVFTFFDMDKSGILRQQWIPAGTVRLEGMKFGNGDIYLIGLGTRSILDGSDIYRIDKEALSAVKMNDVFKEANPDLARGIATVKFSLYGDGFDIMTNTGKKLVYYPQSNLAFDEQALNAYIESGKKGNETVRELVFAARDQKGIFSESSDEFRLMELSRQTEAGYPKEHFSNTNAHRVNLSERDRKEARFAGWRDVLPGRTFFKPDEVLCSNGYYAVIEVHETVLKESPAFLQLIDIPAGDVVWTTKQPHLQSFRGGCAVDGEGKAYFFESQGGVGYSFIFDEQGKVSGGVKWITGREDREKVQEGFKTLSVYKP